LAGKKRAFGEGIPIGGNECEEQSDYQAEERFLGHIGFVGLILIVVTLIGLSLIVLTLIELSGKRISFL
jgi:hypothetical protein